MRRRCRRQSCLLTRCCWRGASVSSLVADTVFSHDAPAPTANTFSRPLRRTFLRISTKFWSIGFAWRFGTRCECRSVDRFAGRFGDLCRSTDRFAWRFDARCECESAGHLGWLRRVLRIPASRPFRKFALAAAVNEASSRTDPTSGVNADQPVISQNASASSATAADGSVHKVLRRPMRMLSLLLLRRPPVQSQLSVVQLLQAACSCVGSGCQAGSSAPAKAAEKPARVLKSGSGAVSSKVATPAAANKYWSFYRGGWSCADRPQGNDYPGCLVLCRLPPRRLIVRRPSPRWSHQSSPRRLRRRRLARRRLVVLLGAACRAVRWCATDHWATCSFAVCETGFSCADCHQGCDRWHHREHWYRCAYSPSCC